MRKITVFILFLLSFVLTSCQTSEDRAIKIVESFINDVLNNPASKYGSLSKSRELINYSYFSLEMQELIRNNYLYLPEKDTYKFTTEKLQDNTIIVNCIGKRANSLGNLVDFENKFVLKEIDGNLFITDSYRLIFFNLDFDILDKQWKTYSDIQKSRIVKEIIENVKLEIVQKGYKLYPTIVTGRLQILNYSNYDLSNLKILIEHFDRNGIPVNTDTEHTNNIIKANSYSVINWMSTQCLTCATQKFSIKFFDE